MKTDKRTEIIVVFFVIIICIFVNGEDCITLKNNHTICCKLKLESENYFIKNAVYLEDTAKVDLSDVHRMTINDKTFIRVKNGSMLSQFAELVSDGNLRVYVKKDPFQFANAHFYNAKSKYFSIGDDSLHFYSLTNLIKFVPVETGVREHLYKADVKRWVSIGIRVCSVIPFYLGVNHAIKNENRFYWIPFGIGISMLIVPGLTISPSIKKNITDAISIFNGEKGL